MNTTPQNQIVSTEDVALIRKSKKNLDEVTFVMRAFNTIGTPIDSGIQMLPKNMQQKLQEAIHKALLLALKANLKTLKKNKLGQSSADLAYKLVASASGAAGGFFGVAGFTADLLISTKFMMRSIMDIARSQGEDVHDPEVQLNCLQVFALSGNSPDDDSLDTSYYATRAALRTAINQAGVYIAENGTKKLIEAIAAQTASPMAKLINLIASRYSVQVTEKFAAQAIPVIGAAAGASLNLIFMTHFQKIATAHFSIRRLERKYDVGTVKGIYNLPRIG